MAENKYYEGAKVPVGKKVVCRICELTDNTGTYYPSDLDDNIHLGFTIGKGKAMYWLITWHVSGHCTIYRKDNEGPCMVRRWIDGGQQITIHFK